MKPEEVNRRLSERLGKIEVRKRAPGRNAGVE